MIIAVSGKIGSGKDSFAEYIQKNFPKYDFQIKKHSSNLKDITRIISGQSDQYSHEGKNKTIPNLGITVGELQQKVGEGLRKEVCDEIWSHIVFLGYQDIIRRRYSGGGFLEGDLDESIENLGKPNWIITDLRYRSEVNYIKKIDPNVILVRIEGEWDGVEELRKGRDMNHISEIDLDDFDGWTVKIINDTTEKEFEQKIKHFCKQYI